MKGEEYTLNCTIHPSIPSSNTYTQTLHKLESQIRDTHTILLYRAFAIREKELKKEGKGWKKQAFSSRFRSASLNSSVLSTSLEQQRIYEQVSLEFCSLDKFHNEYKVGVQHVDVCVSGVRVLGSGLRWGEGGLDFEEVQVKLPFGTGIELYSKSEGVLTWSLDKGLYDGDGVNEQPIIWTSAPISLHKNISLHNTPIQVLQDLVYARTLMNAYLAVFNLSLTSPTSRMFPSTLVSPPTLVDVHIQDIGHLRIHEWGSMDCFQSARVDFEGGGYLDLPQGMRDSKCANLKVLLCKEAVERVVHLRDVLTSASTLSTPLDTLYTPLDSSSTPMDSFSTPLDSSSTSSNPLETLKLPNLTFQSVCIELTQGTIPLVGLKALDVHVCASSITSAQINMTSSWMQEERVKIEEVSYKEDYNNNKHVLSLTNLYYDLTQHHVDVHNLQYTHIHSLLREGVDYLQLLTHCLHSTPLTIFSTPSSPSSPSSLLQHTDTFPTLSLHSSSITLPASRLQLQTHHSILVHIHLMEFSSNWSHFAFTHVSLPSKSTSVNASCRLVKTLRDSLYTHPPLQWGVFHTHTRVSTYQSKLLLHLHQPLEIDLDLDYLHLIQCVLSENLVDWRRSEVDYDKGKVVFRDEEVDSTKYELPSFDELPSNDLSSLDASMEELEVSIRDQLSHVQVDTLGVVVRVRLTDKTVELHTSSLTFSSQTKMDYSVSSVWALHNVYLCQCQGGVGMVQKKSSESNEEGYVNTSSSPSDSSTTPSIKSSSPNKSTTPSIKSTKKNKTQQVLHIPSLSILRTRSGAQERMCFTSPLCHQLSPFNMAKWLSILDERMARIRFKCLPRRVRVKFYTGGVETWVHKYGEIQNVRLRGVKAACKEENVSLQVELLVTQTHKLLHGEVPLRVDFERETNEGVFIERTHVNVETRFEGQMTMPHLLCLLETLQGDVGVIQGGTRGMHKGISSVKEIQKENTNFPQTTSKKKVFIVITLPPGEVTIVDSHSYPVFRLAWSQFVLRRSVSAPHTSNSLCTFHDASSTSQKGVHVSHFHPDLARWEPVVEPWTFDMMVQESEGNTSFDVDSVVPLNLNLSLGCLQSLDLFLHDLKFVSCSFDSTSSPSIPTMSTTPPIPKTTPLVPIKTPPIPIPTPPKPIPWTRDRTELVNETGVTLHARQGDRKQEVPYKGRFTIIGTSPISLRLLTNHEFLLSTNKLDVGSFLLSNKQTHELFVQVSSLHGFKSVYIRSPVRFQNRGMLALSVQITGDLTASTLERDAWIEVAYSLVHSSTCTIKVGPAGKAGYTLWEVDVAMRHQEWSPTCTHVHSNHQLHWILSRNGHVVEFWPVLVVENRLPVTLYFTVSDPTPPSSKPFFSSRKPGLSSSKRLFYSHVARAQDLGLHEGVGEENTLSLRMQGSAWTQPIGLKGVSTLVKVQHAHESQPPLNVCVDIVRTSTHMLLVTVYARSWLVDRTGLGLRFQVASGGQEVLFGRVSVQGMDTNGMSVQGMDTNGMSVQGMDTNGMSVQGMDTNGMSVQGMDTSSVSVQGVDTSGVMKQMNSSLVHGGQEKTNLVDTNLVRRVGESAEFLVEGVGTEGQVKKWIHGIILDIDTKQSLLKMLSMDGTTYQDIKTLRSLSDTPTHDAIPSKSQEDVLVMCSESKLLSVKYKEAWSSAFYAETVGSAGVVSLVGDQNKVDVCVVVQNASGKFHRTKVVSFLPRMVVHFESEEYCLWVREGKGGSKTSLNPSKQENIRINGSQFVFSPLTPGNTQLVLDHKNVVDFNNQSQLSSTGWAWSGGVDLFRIGDVCVKLSNKTTSEVVVLTLRVRMTSSMLVVQVSMDTPLYQVANHSSHLLHYFQSPFLGIRGVVERVFPGETRVFGWDHPSQPHKTLEVLCADHQSTLSLKPDDLNDQVQVSTSISGSTRVQHGIKTILITDSSHIHPLPSPYHLHATESKALFVQISVVSIHVSVIDAYPQELVLVTGKGVCMSMLRQPNQTRAWTLAVHQVQMDNQLLDARFPVLLLHEAASDRPVMECSLLENTFVEEVHSFSECSVYVHAPLNVQCEEALLLLLCRFVVEAHYILTSSIRVHTNGTSYPPSCQPASSNISTNDNSTSVPGDPTTKHPTRVYTTSGRSTMDRTTSDPKDPTPSKLPTSPTYSNTPPLPLPHTPFLLPSYSTASPALLESKFVYFDSLSISKILVNLTLELLPQERAQVLMFPSPFMPHFSPHAVLALFPPLLSVEEHSFVYASKYIPHAFMPWRELAGLLFKAFQQETVAHLYSLIGKAELLGNPLGLLIEVQLGLTDFFVEPALGITSLAHFSEGVKRGTSSLVNHTLHGTLDSVAKLTGALGSSFALLSMDPTFLANRRASLHHRRPLSSSQGVKLALESVSIGVGHGLVGLAMHPLVGAVEGGGMGFMQGVVKGVVGVAIKPVTGVFDMVSRLFSGLGREFHVKSVVERTFDSTSPYRLPRMMLRGKLDVYDERLAFVQRVMTGVWGYSKWRGGDVFVGFKPVS